jgi:hypothetical protein
MREALLEAATVQPRLRFFQAKKGVVDGRFTAGAWM